MLSLIYLVILPVSYAT